jgi:hypothetical protein
LEKAKEKKITLYMSIIVYEELKRHTIKNYKSAQKAYTSAIFELNKFIPQNEAIMPRIDIEKEFVAFYETFKKDFNLHILNFKNDFFPSVMERALNRQKPFNNDKTEVKDCTIWLTYADYVETSKMSDCFLLTNNSKDFYSKELVSDDPIEYALHEDLQKDSKRVKGFPSVKDFFRKILEPQIHASEAFQKWLTETKVNEEYVFNLILENEKNKIESAIGKSVDRMDVDRLFHDEEWYISGYCQINDIEWVDCNELEVDTLENSCIITSVLNLNVAVEGNAYNPVHDDAEDKYSYVGEKDLHFHISVSFTLKENDDYDFFDITDVEYGEY